MQPSEHYRAVRSEVTALAADLSDEQQQIRVPGCPAWTVRELVSHLSGLSRDLCEGRIDGAGSPPWTALQVADRQDRSLAELLAEWAECGPQVDAVMDELGVAGFRIFYDAALHEDDLREALDLPLASSPTHAEVLDGLVALAGQRIAAAGLPALTMVAGDRTWSGGENTVTVSSTGELSRALAGRRTAEQLRGYGWIGDGEPYLAHLPMFAPGESS